MRERLRVLRHRDFRNLWLAQTTSAMGDGVVVVALALFVTDLTENPTDVGIVLAAQLLPLVGFLLIGGVWADRLRRAKVMVAGGRGGPGALEPHLKPGRAHRAGDRDRPGARRRRGLGLPARRSHLRRERAAARSRPGDRDGTPRRPSSGSSRPPTGPARSRARWSASAGGRATRCVPGSSCSPRGR